MYYISGEKGGWLNIKQNDFPFTVESMTMIMGMKTFKHLRSGRWDSSLVKKLISEHNQNLEAGQTTEWLIFFEAWSQKVINLQEEPANTSLS